MQTLRRFAPRLAPAPVHGLPLLLAAALLGACSDDASGSDGEEASVVAVGYQGEVVDVALDGLATEEAKSVEAVRLSTVWEEAGFAVDPATVELEFVAEDGFRPSQKESCAEPLGGALLESGYIDPATRNLVWPDELGLPGCYSVRGLALIEASDASAE